MTVLFVLAIFAFFIALDAWSSRRVAVPAALAATSAAPPVEPEAFPVEPIWVSGYQVPDGLHYHRGHLWVRPTGADTAVVGIDDFARRLIGLATKVALPRPGTWVRPGDRAARLGLDGREAELVAPMEGEVVATNPLVEKQPGLATIDPYGRGWLYKVRTNELPRNLANLLGGSLAHRFVEDSKERLQLQLMALSGSVLADGGEPAADFARHLTDDDWHRLTREFLLT